jgi:isoprenylcysteine carboxyl methyltransferase (ICMT) family protein YpbQ
VPFFGAIKAVWTERLVSLLWQADDSFSYKPEFSVANLSLFLAAGISMIIFFIFNKRILVTRISENKQI